MNARFNSLVSSIGSVLGLGVVAGLRICLADTMYFSLSLSANLLTPWYADRTPGMTGGILIGFNFLIFSTFLTFEALRELLR